MNNKQVDATISDWLTTYGSSEANIAALLCDRHDPDAVAFSFIDSTSLAVRDLSYRELSDRSSRMATVLRGRGVRHGDRVPVLMAKRPELIITLLAIWRLGAVHVPLFTAFATGAIQLRVEGAGARVVITEPSQREKLDPLAGLDVLETGEILEREIDNSPPTVQSVAVGANGAMVELYTSGTTGKPKGVVVPAWALASMHSYLHFGLDVQPQDVFWNAADPGWAYGLYYGVIGPLVTGRRNLLLSGGFTPESTVNVLREFGVTNFAGAPTIYRALNKSNLVSGLNLRRASSAGEPLTPDVVAWGRQKLGVEVRDHYGQTEVGMVIGNGWHDSISRPVKDGSMGQVLPGFTAGVVDGQIAIDVPNSPFMFFEGYRGDVDRTAKRFAVDGRWYLTADTGRVDDDGYFFFTARDDDVILAAGYRIGPFDVESVLITHPAVAEVAVVGLPDPDGIRGEVVAAFVVLSGSQVAGEDLVEELQALVRDRYSKHAYPRVVTFVDELPKTPSGKVQRFLLRQ